MSDIKIDISPEVFKIRDLKVIALRRGSMPLEKFALSIQPSDPYVLIGNTIHALSEREFYELRSVTPADNYGEEVYKYLVNEGADISMMSAEDQDKILEVRKQKTGCPTCRMRKYRNVMFDLYKKYNLKLPIRNNITSNTTVSYPNTSFPVEERVHDDVLNMLTLAPVARRPCIDCVEKHLSQAYVLSCEYNQGYTEYSYLIAGHLAEAVAEVPPEMKYLKDTLEFCLAYMGKQGKPFVPINAIYPLLTIARASLNAERAADDTESKVLDLDLTLEARRELVHVLGSLGDSLIRNLSEADEAAASEEQDEPKRLFWEGRMACAADSISNIAPAVAGILRNRRLMFVGCPAAAAQAGYSNGDIIAALKARQG